MKARIRGMNLPRDTCEALDKGEGIPEANVVSGGGFRRRKRRKQSKGMRPMKGYHICRVVARAGTVLFCADAYVCLYVYGEHLMYATPITRWLLVPLVLLAVLLVGMILYGAVYVIRKARAPRILGVIGAETIRKCMEGKACSTKFSKDSRH